MKYGIRTRRFLALILCASLWNFMSIAGIAGDLSGRKSGGDISDTVPPFAEMLSPKHPGPNPFGSAAPEPRGISSSFGEVYWGMLGTRSWNCRVGDNSAVSLSLPSHGKIHVLAESNVNFTAGAEELTVTLLRGSIHVAKAPLHRIRVETFEGAYVIEDGAAAETRFSWRAGRLAVRGDPVPRLQAGAAAMTASHLSICPAAEAGAPTDGDSIRVSALVRDPAGLPLPGVPVVFSSGAPESSPSVSFGGTDRRRVLTDDRGVAEANAAVTRRHGNPVTLSARVEGTQTPASVPVQEGRTTGRQKLAAWMILAGLSAATIMLVIRATDKDDPKLEAATPVSVVP